MAQSRKNNSNNKKNEPRQKTDKKASNKQTEETKKQSPTVRREVQGVIWIAIGLFLAVSTYFLAGGVFGKFISGVVCGLVGILGYVLPIICIVIGGFLIFKPQARVLGFSVKLGAVLLVLLVLININLLNVNEYKFFPYIGAAYTKGLGGAVSAFLAYPIAKLLGQVGSNIVLIAAIIIFSLLTFHYSIKSAYDKVAGGIKKKHEQNVEKKTKALAERNETDSDDDEVPFEYDDDYDYDGTPAPDYDYSEPEYTDADYDYRGNDYPDVDKSQVQQEKTGHDSQETDEDAPVEKMSYQRPPYNLLAYPKSSSTGSAENLDRKAKDLAAALASFKVKIRITDITVGPTITRFEIQLAEGVRIKSITSLSQDIALALAAEKVRIEAPIPGKQAIGIEVPNSVVSTVYLRELLENNEFKTAQSPLTTVIGKDIVGKPVIADIAKMPHLLIAGATGSGKSVCLNVIILSLIFKSSPADLRLILIDPKEVEFRVYEKLPHLLIPVVTNKQKADSALKWAVSEMERRNRELARVGARNIDRYNLLQTNPEDRMPRLVIIIDELAELMMSSGKDVEDSITRIAQLGRSGGIHLIVATQRPSVDIITGKIKANIISRIAFAVSDATNSKVILDTIGAESLIGRGDMLCHLAGNQKPRRIQCAFVSDEEVEDIAEFFSRTQGAPEFDSIVDSQITAGISSMDNDDMGGDVFADEMFKEAARTVVETQRPTASFLQQRLRIGYNRASRMIEEMERIGIVSGFDNRKQRVVLVDSFALDKILKSYTNGGN